MFRKGKLEYLHNENVSLPKKLETSLLQMDGNETELLKLADRDRKESISCKQPIRLDITGMANSHSICTTSMELKAMTHLDGKSASTQGVSLQEGLYNDEATTVTDVSMGEINKTIPMDTEELIEPSQHCSTHDMLVENDLNDPSGTTLDNSWDTLGIVSLLSASY
ncbi:hypothetical protein QAD02_002734 [Eretmocerus hayati]|uniref:Uncharacterized protein n=1 Tax=Eretmocerus hayati TaxID=131215 RepID=A0ACC2NPL6_9HYME|nr:hypothetical protein QAD02_002734 [Eretmocerus hayati]